MCLPWSKWGGEWCDGKQLVQKQSSTESVLGLVSWCYSGCWETSVGLAQRHPAIKYPGRIWESLAGFQSFTIYHWQQKRVCYRLVSQDVNSQMIQCLVHISSLNSCFYWLPRRNIESSHNAHHGFCQTGNSGRSSKGTGSPVGIWLKDKIWWVSYISCHTLPLLL